MNDYLTALAAAAISATLTALLFYVWYAATLSRVFAQLGAPGWKAWVPILNESEILRLGGVPAWQVVFYLVPVLNLYGLYLKASAVSRINAHFGRGVGATVLGILLPPVWSTLLAAGSGPADPALQERIATSLEPRSGYAFAVSTPSSPLPPPGAAGPPPLVAPPVPPSLVNPDAPRAAPVVPPPLATSPVPPGMPTPPAPPAPPSPPAPPTSAEPPAPPAASAPPLVAAPPVVPAPPTAPSTQIVPPAGLLPPPPVVSPPPVVAPPELPAQPWAPLGQPTVPPPAPAEPEPAADEEELDRTVVVDRRPVVPWRLVVEGGPTFRLTGSSAVLGRRPSGAGAGAQEIAVPDPTRTLSKVHARLDLADGAWTVTDLNATNGVIVTRPDGTEDLLDPGASAAISGRFVLGKVGMRLNFGEDDAVS